MQKNTDLTMLSLPEKLKLLARENPHQVIMQDETETGFVTFTYQDFLAEAEKIAQVLHGLGVRKGDRVALILENSAKWGMVYFGILFAEAVAVPLDTQATQNDLNYFLKNSGSKIIFTHQKFLGVLQLATKLTSLKKIIVVKRNIEQKIAPLPLASRKIFFYQKLLTKLGKKKATMKLPEPNDLAAIIYTSGTTGKPKGVMLTHRNFYANFLSILELNFLHKKENILALLPLHHTFPFMTCLILPLFTQNKVTFPKTLQGESLFHCIHKAGITAIIAVPQFYYLLYEKMQRNIADKLWLLRLPFLGLVESGFVLSKACRMNVAKVLLLKMQRRFGKKIRFFVSGGAKLDSEVKRFFYKFGFNILEGYGLTETAPVVTFNPLTKLKFASVGKAIPQVKIKINEPDRAGVGEILIKGANVMRGYYKAPSKTREVLRDGWFYSGDLGYLDPDGYLYIVGRQSEMIVLPNGKNITPDEIEQYYAQSPFIKELCVLAVGNGRRDKLMAVIVPDLAYFRKTGEVNFHNTIKWSLENLSRTLAPFKRLMGFVLVQEDLPRTHLGKLRRYLIKEKYRAELLGKTSKKLTAETASYNQADLAILNSEIGKKILHILVRDIGCKEGIRLDDHLELDLGLDSLKRLELIVILEKALRVKIPEHVVARIFTVRELIHEMVLLANKNGISSKKIKAAIPEEHLLWREILGAPLPKEVKAHIDLAPNRFHRALAYLIDGFLYVLFRLFWRLKVFGQENLPKNQAFLLCMNHTSFLDALVITAAIPEGRQKDIFFLGLLSLVRAGVMKKMQKLIRFIPISAAEQLVPAMQAGAYVLKHGKILGIFPEAARSIDGKVKPFKAGASILLEETKVSAVPAYIEGAFEAWPRGQSFPKPYPVKVIFGKPCTYQELKTLGKKMGIKDDYEAIAAALREKVLALRPKKKD